MQDDQKNIAQLRSLSRLLDTKFQGPLGTRYGMDALIGLIPGVGDFITSALSFYIIAQATALGVSSATLIRMAINIIFENVIDMIPFVGNLFDFYWKANKMNLDLIESHLKNPTRETIQSRTVVALIFIVLLLMLIASGYITWLVIEALYHLITNRPD
jgi:hypothetical protein